MWVKGIWKVCKKCESASPYYEGEALQCSECGSMRVLKNLGTCKCSTCGGEGVILEKENTTTPIIIRRKKPIVEVNLMDFI